MRDLLLCVTLYPTFLSIQVGLDKLCGWPLARALGKEPK